MTNAPDPNYIKLPPYPGDSDAKIRRVAELVAYDAAIKVLDTIKNELLGDSERAKDIAHYWGTDPTMNDAKLSLNSMRDDLVSYWEGPAFNAFNTYSINVVGVMDRDLSVMGTVATTLGSTVQTVFETYAAAITFIGNCVANLAGLGAWAAIAAASAPVPGVNVLATAAFANKLVDALTTFVKDETALFATAVSKIGSYQSQGISFANQATQFQHPEHVPSAVSHTRQWRVQSNA